MREIDRRVLGHIENSYVIRKFPGTTKRLEARGLIERTGPLRRWALTPAGAVVLACAKAVEAQGVGR
ncbi:hypothetical protein [Rhodopseudomonas pseudopalustris]|uniref:Uncharacterized protein n=1 Tax=Rhodopseudomonas pseudopalustris TaxID=1513892 RepID=A0A1H8WIF7_9BRAD|nr:hypothetical protein [Rhodopseudomonas pseudopalustris]SEP27207.1 hypothetical protein SAMN05444123_112106 [Rhodopseudomonas pseudopalustris]